jgi:surfactin synthase thioesterase subunit
MNTPTTSVEPRWFRRNARASSPLRLFCFAYAGGSASMYRSWHDWLAPAVEVVAVELPGRGTHIGEPPIDRMDALVERLLPAMRPLLDRPFALFGHSLGALVALEVSRALDAAGPRPQHLFVAGMGAPHVRTDAVAIHGLPDREFLAAVGALNGTPPDVFADPELVKIFLDILRADFRLAERYDCRRPVRLRHAITAFGGVTDESVRRGDLEAWQEHTARQCVVRWLPGDHFFVREHERLITVMLRSLLRADERCDAGAVVA